MNGRKPLYLMAGGDFRRPSGVIPRIRAILGETGRAHPRVAYIGTASGDDASFYRSASDWIRRAGAGPVRHALLSPGKADPAGARALLGDADAVFVSGGDVREGMRPIERGGLVPFLRGLYDSGTLFFGISAGSIMLGTHWVEWKDPDDDASAGLFRCIGMAPLVCDTHAEPEGWAELKAAVRLLGEGGRGYGIPTSGTLRVDPDGTVAALDRPTACYGKRSGVVAALEAIPVRGGRGRAP